MEREVGGGVRRMGKGQGGRVFCELGVDFFFLLLKVVDLDCFQP